MNRTLHHRAERPHAAIYAAALYILATSRQYQSVSISQCGSLPCLPGTYCVQSTFAYSLGNPAANTRPLIRWTLSLGLFTSTQRREKWTRIVP